MTTTLPTAPAAFARTAARPAAWRGLEGVDASLRGLLELPVDDLGDTDLTVTQAQVATVARLAEAINSRLAGEIAHRSRRELGEDGLAAGFGHRTAQAFLERLTGDSSDDVSRRLRVAAATRPVVAPSPGVGDAPDADGASRASARPDFPAVASALAAGRISEAAAAAIISVLGQLRPRVEAGFLADAEEALVAKAPILTVSEIIAEARTLRDELDPRGSEDRHQKLLDQRYLRLTPQLDGMVRIAGLADPMSAAVLVNAINAIAGPTAGPRFQDAEARKETVKDDRTHGQRQLDGLVNLITAGVATNDKPSIRARATTLVMVSITKEQFESGEGVAWLAGSQEPVPASLARALACDGDRRIIVKNQKGEPLWLGRAEREFTVPQRLVLADRDRHCIWPGCSAPPSACHAHHVDEWQADDGPTDVDRGVLLCPMHHFELHRSKKRVRMVKGRGVIVGYAATPIAGRVFELGGADPGGADPGGGASGGGGSGGADPGGGGSGGGGCGSGRGGLGGRGSPPPELG